jgi:bifunctional oligoribonuclease and PAP phosphatase NrnA
MTVKLLLKSIRKYKSFIVTTHLNPDPDAICAALAAAEFLKAQGKRAVVLNNDLPRRWMSIPGVKAMKVYRPGIRVKAEAMVVVDCGGLDRIGSVNALAPGKTIINIDHHVTNTSFGHVRYVDPTASSTTEILYDVFKAAHCPLTKKTAYYLYVGTMTDTGSFRYENTTSKTHLVAAELMGYGFHPADVYHDYYEMLPLRGMKALMDVLGRFETMFRGRLLWVEIKKKDMKKFSDEFDLKDLIFQFLRCIQGVDLVVILNENGPKETRVNFRSGRSFNAAELASRLGGGGHRRASGATLSAGPRAARAIVYKEIKRMM